MNKKILVLFLIFSVFSLKEMICVTAEECKANCEEGYQNCQKMMRKGITMFISCEQSRDICISKCPGEKVTTVEKPEKKVANLSNLSQ